MTMLLLVGAMVRVRPVTGKKNWFAIDAVPKIHSYADLGDWLIDEMADNVSEIVRGAKLVGIHDDESILEDDPRFNFEAGVAGEDPEFQNEPAFVVVRQLKRPPHRPEDLYLCAMLVNAPEVAFLEYSAKGGCPNFCV
ncbi:MAG: hypothetical protein KDA57_19320 [Planctomycetales bacterium]|nr:hypothetical protein [Planctomycetales bacterium]